MRFFAAIIFAVQPDVRHQSCLLRPTELRSSDGYLCYRCRQCVAVRAVSSSNDASLELLYRVYRPDGCLIIFSRMIQSVYGLNATKLRNFNAKVLNETASEIYDAANNTFPKPQPFVFAKLIAANATGNTTGEGTTPNGTSAGDDGPDHHTSGLAMYVLFLSSMRPSK